MGDLGEGQTDTLDERMWGDDEDDQEGSDEEEESGQGVDQVCKCSFCRRAGGGRFMNIYEARTSCSTEQSFSKSY